MANLEIREDSSYTFTFSRTVDNALKGMTSASLLIYDSSGSVYQSSTAMTVSSNVATKAINFATDPTGLTYSKDRNYKVEYRVVWADTTVEYFAQFFDIVMYPFANLVTDQDLMDENRMIENGIQEEGGTASSGSTTTLVDLNRIESDDFWNGGKLFILPTDDTGKISEHTVTDFVKSTGTLTFTPALSGGVTTQSYTLRRSYQAQINQAGNIVRDDIAAQGKKAYLMVDSTQVNRLIVCKCLERYFQQIRKADGDQYDLQFKYYKEEYDKLFNSIPLLYDTDEDGSISTTEGTPSSFNIVEISR